MLPLKQRKERREEKRSWLRYRVQCKGSVGVKHLEEAYSNICNTSVYRQQVQQNKPYLIQYCEENKIQISAATDI